MKKLLTVIFMFISTTIFATNKVIAWHLTIVNNAPRPISVTSVDAGGNDCWIPYDFDKQQSIYIQAGEIKEILSFEDKNSSYCFNRDYAYQRFKISDTQFSLVSAYDHKNRYVRNETLDKGGNKKATLLVTKYDANGQAVLDRIPTVVNATIVVNSTTTLDMLPTALDWYSFGPFGNLK